MSPAALGDDVTARTRALIGDAIFETLLAQGNRAAIANLVEGLGTADGAEREALARAWREASGEAAPAGVPKETAPTRADPFPAASPPQGSAPAASAPVPAPRTSVPISIQVLVGANGLDSFEGERTEERRLAMLEQLEKPLPLLPLQAAQARVEPVLAAFPWFAADDGAAAIYARAIRIGLRLGRPAVRLPPMLLAGPPGIGKSSFLSALITALGGVVYADTFAGVSDALSITGSSPTFQAAQASLPVRAMLATGCANPAVVLDEIDKVGADMRFGHPHDALLPLLEPVTAAAYRDRFLDRLVDASHISFAATANDVAGLAPALRSRLTIVTSPGPGPEHAEAVIAGLRQRLAAHWQVDASAIPDGGDIALQAVRTALRRSADMRPISRAWTAIVERLLVTA